jgi:hypothetical protein
MIEITFTREELSHLYDVLLKNHLQVKQSVMNKIDEELIADKIFELLGELECLDTYLNDEWQDKLWYDDPEDEYTIAVKRNRNLWNRQTIAELKSIIAKLEENK